jgi:hypothetical protein
LLRTASAIFSSNIKILRFETIYRAASSGRRMGRVVVGSVGAAIEAAAIDL